MAWYGLWSSPCIADYVEIWVAERMREQFALGVPASKEQDDDLYDSLYDRSMTHCMTGRWMPVRSPEGAVTGAGCALPHFSLRNGGKTE